MKRKNVLRNLPMQHIRLNGKMSVRQQPYPPGACRLSEQNGNDILLKAVYHQITGI